MGILGGLITMAVKDALTPGLELTAEDYLAGAAVGMVAGALIGSGAGAGAGFAILASAGTGMATSAIGYTIASGKDYKTKEMAVSATVGAAAGALSGGVSNHFGNLARPSALNSGGWFNKSLLNGAINGGANILQLLITGERDGDDLAGVGSAGFGVGFLVEAFSNGSGKNKIIATGIKQALRSVTAEYYMNESTDCDRKFDFDIC